MSATNLFIIGTHRSGTTSLYQYLGSHPEIQHGYKKEFHYFTPGIYSGKYSYDSAQYASNFPKTNKLYLEASPSYFYGRRELAQTLKNHFPESKVLLILRKPTDRFFSFLNHYNSKVSPIKRLNPEQFVKESLKQYQEGQLVDTPANRGLREGVYADCLTDWIEEYGEELKVIFFEDLKNNPSQLLSDCFRFLGLKNIEFKSNLIYNKNRDSRFFTLHKVAIALNDVAEPFFSRFGLLKSALKSAYSFLNEKPFTHSANQDLISEVTSFYKSHNQRLKKILVENNLPLPEWIH